jgi:deoxyribonuclease-4
MLTLDQIKNYIPTLVNMIKEIVNKYKYYEYYLSGTIKYNTEYKYKEFAGHPDIVTDTCVLDIKTTSSFTKMSKESCLQVLAYYALIKSQNPNIQTIGFVLPMQREIILCDVSSWDFTKYLQILSDGANNLIQKQTMYKFSSLLICNQNWDKSLFMNIGAHIPKGKHIATSLQEFTLKYPGCPCQMFLGNPRTGKRSAKTIDQIPEAAAVIVNSGLIYFTHASYVINLCSNKHDQDGCWQQKYLNEDLQYTVAMGGKGVVVHTGQSTNKSVNDALSTMENMIRIALAYATEECPLLLETPCNEGTEVCGKIEELNDFFLRFSSEEQKKLGLCVDTCHVFAAGYDPLLYLQSWLKIHNDISIKLVHFNDSLGKCGSCIDRHATPGLGNIGIDKMNKIAEYCIENNMTRSLVILWSENNYDQRIKTM